MYYFKYWHHCNFDFCFTCIKFVKGTISLLFVTCGSIFFLSVTGSYLFVEASPPRKPGERARIATPLSAKASGQCLQFWYHMYGKDMGTLQVHAIDNRTMTTSKLLWTKSGDQGKIWALEHVPLPQIPVQMVSTAGHEQWNLLCL